MRFAKHGRLVEIHWWDAAASGGWRSSGSNDYETQGVLLCKTAGYLVKRNKKCITVVQNVSEQGAKGEGMTIPAGCIVRVRRVK